MPDQSSFDIISEVNLQEVDNAVNQAAKEIKTRYDFKDSKSSIEFLKQDKKIKLVGDDDLKLRNLQDILKTRMAARKISLKSLEFTDPEQTFEGTLTQEVSLVVGIPQDQAKEVVKVIKESKLKVQPAIQGEQIRVSSKSKDELQAAIQLLRTSTFKVPLQFTNFR